MKKETRKAVRRAYRFLMKHGLKRAPLPYPQFVLLVGEPDYQEYLKNCPGIGTEDDKLIKEVIFGEQS